MSVNVIDEDEIEDAMPGAFVISEVGVGVGALGILGIEIPLGDHFALFGEGRAGVEVQLTDAGGVDVENIGGVGGMFGLRIRF
jgi:hypothetical protein